MPQRCKLLSQCLSTAVEAPCQSERIATPIPRRATGTSIRTASTAARRRWWPWGSSSATGESPSLRGNRRPKRSGSQLGGQYWSVRRLRSVSKHRSPRVQEFRTAPPELLDLEAQRVTAHGVVAIFISLRAEHERSPGEVLNLRFRGKLGAWRRSAAIGRIAPTGTCAQCRSTAIFRRRELTKFRPSSVPHLECVVNLDAEIPLQRDKGSIAPPSSTFREPSPGK